MTEEPDEHAERLQSVVDEWLLTMQLEGTAPMVAAASLFDVLYKTMSVTMGEGALRTALMWVYENSHPEPTTFIERDKAKKLLDQVSNLRRGIEGKPHLILPGEED